MSLRGRPGPIPRLSPPPPFRERRRTLRRAADRHLQRETTFLARSVDIAALEAPAEERLARVLDLLARTAGAAQAALVVDSVERRVIVALPEGAPAAEADALATWLDAHAPRPRPYRAAALPAPLSIATIPPGRARAARPVRQPHFALQPLPDGGRTALGFTFRSERSARALPDRLPTPLARHAAAILSLLTRQVDDEGDLETLRGQDAERRRFVRTVTHELRTPLSALSGYLDLLLQDPADDRRTRTEFLHRSRDLVDGLAHLVGDLLEMSRLESGQLRLVEGPFSGAEVGQAALDAVMPLARVRALALTARLPSRLRTIYADRRRVEQILINLLSNAIKFTPAGAHVDLELRFEGAVACYIVRDSGDGIGPDDRVRIFEPFYRGAAEGRIVGTGLGLPITRELAQRMGGDLVVASVEARGTSFVVGLPATSSVEPGLVAGALGRVVRAEERCLAEEAPALGRTGSGLTVRNRIAGRVASAGGELLAVHGSLAIAD